MHPALSLILFSSLSGAGLGLLGLLGLVGGPAALWVIGMALAVAGLLASVAHLARPSRAWRAVSQVRSSWLSREAWAAFAVLGAGGLATLLALTGRTVGALGPVVTLAAAATVTCTAMIYAQMRTVPRWHHWTTPAHFAAWALASGALLLSLPAAWIWAALALAAALQLAHWHHGRTAFARAGQTAATATALAGQVTQFAPPHTGPNYLTREMMAVVGRRRAANLRFLALALGIAAPAVGAMWMPGLLMWPVHIAGVFAARWLFLAEAEHVVGLYYGVR